MQRSEEEAQAAMASMPHATGSTGEGRQEGQTPSGALVEDPVVDPTFQDDSMPDQDMRALLQKEAEASASVAAMPSLQGSSLLQVVDDSADPGHVTSSPSAATDWDLIGKLASEAAKEAQKPSAPSPVPQPPMKKQRLVQRALDDIKAANDLFPHPSLARPSPAPKSWARLKKE